MKRRHSWRYVPPRPGDFKREVMLAVIASCTCLIALTLFLLSIGVVL
jgi:hypothetical protein